MAPVELTVAKGKFVTKVRTDSLELCAYVCMYACLYVVYVRLCVYVS